MTRIPNSKTDFETMSHSERARIYRAARSFALANEDGLTCAAFDADMESKASNLVDWSRGASMASSALWDYLGSFTTNHTHTSPETELWSSWEATKFSTTEQHPAAWARL